MASAWGMPTLSPVQGEVDFVVAETAEIITASCASGAWGRPPTVFLGQSWKILKEGVGQMIIICSSTPGCIN
eukprot:15366117-Ditylum_brightwellii.AAC.2